jgi:uncharacterized membrane protein YvlD (DUF360 family)
VHKVLSYLLIYFFVAIASYVTLLTSSVVFGCVFRLFNPVLRTSSFPIAMWS